MNKNKFVQLFEKHNWIVENHGDNNFIAYNDTYFVPFSCVPFAYEDAATISCVSYCVSDKENFIDQWRRYNQDVENTHFECKIGDFAFKMYSKNSKHIKKLSHIGCLANCGHSISEVEHWLDTLAMSKKYIDNDSIDEYSADLYGCIMAIRIYLVDYHIPMADLLFAYDGRYTTIEWTNVFHRSKYEHGIDGYTLIYDERPKKEFKEWIL